MNGMALHNQQIVEPFNMAVHDRHTFAEVLKFARREFKSAFDIIYDSSMYRFLRRQIQIANRRMSDDVLHVGFIRTGAQAIEVWAQVKDNEVRFYSGAADDYLLSTIEPFPSNGMTRITGLTYPFDLINGAISNDASPKKPKTISQNKAKLGLALMIKFAFLLTDRLTHLEQRGYTSTPKAFKEMCLHLQEQKSAQGGQGGAVAKIEDEDDVVMLEGPVEQTLALANTPAPRQITAQLDQPDDAQCAHQPHLETSQYPVQRSALASISTESCLTTLTDHKLHVPSDRFARFADILHTEFYQVVQDEVKEIRTTADSQAHRIHDLEGELAKCKQSLREEKAKGEQWRRQYWSLKNNVDKLAACENGKMEGVQ